MCLAKGLVDRLNSPKPNLFYEKHDGITYQIDIPQMDYSEVFHLILATLIDKERGILRNLDEISAVGHRVVHGGSHFAESTVITPSVEGAIRQSVSLAPLHNPYNLQGILACREILSDIPHVAVFDTAFYQTMPDYSYMYPLPYHFYEQYGIRRYGFHGISHRYVSGRTAEILGWPLESLKLISCHLGNGCSITAIDQGKVIDTSMGFTPLEGLMMGTRCGDIDPAIIFHLMDEHRMSAQAINQILNGESGLLGVSGVGSDARDLFHAVSEDNQRAVLALKMFCYRATQYIGKYAAVLGGLDVLIFTAGIGENAPRVRAKICETLGFLGIRLNQKKNRSVGVEKAIHRAGAPVQILVIPTNEELMIARDTFRLIVEKPSVEQFDPVAKFTRLVQLVEEQEDPEVGQSEIPPMEEGADLSESRQSIPGASGRATETELRGREVASQSQAEQVELRPDRDEISDHKSGEDPLRHLQSTPPGSNQQYIPSQMPLPTLKSTVDSRVWESNTVEAERVNESESLDSLRAGDVPRDIRLAQSILESAERASDKPPFSSTQSAVKSEAQTPLSPAERFNQLINAGRYDEVGANATDSANIDSDADSPIAPPAWVSVYDETRKKSDE